MHTDNHVMTIQRWFDRARFAGVILPDGWWGKPYDNLHTLTHATSDRETVTLDFETTFVLVFYDLQRVYEAEKDLILDGFSRLDVLGGNEPEPATPYCTYHESGIVRFVDY